MWRSVLPGNVGITGVESQVKATLSVSKNANVHCKPSAMDHLGLDPGPHTHQAFVLDCCVALQMKEYRHVILVVGGIEPSYINERAP